MILGERLSDETVFYFGAAVFHPCSETNFTRESKVLFMKIILSICTLAIAFAVTASAQSAKVSANDLRPLEGKEWVGSLAYLDYSSKRKTSIKSNITVTRSSKDKLTWVFAMKYPLEPDANHTEEVKLSPDGGSFDGETVIERTKLSNGVLRIVTSKPGKDDGRDATFRHTYLISRSSFSFRKEVKLESTTDYFERNTYTWTR